MFCCISRLSLQRTSTATKEYALAERIKTVDSVLIRTQIKFSKPLNEWSTKYFPYIICIFFLPSSCCFSCGITLKIVAFSLRLHVSVVVFIHEKKTDSVFPPSVTPLSTMLWSGAIIYLERGTFLIQCTPIGIRSGYIWFYSRPCDQESANGCPCLVEWKSRNIATVYVNWRPSCSLQSGNCGEKSGELGRKLLSFFY